MKAHEPKEGGCQKLFIKQHNNQMCSGGTCDFCVDLCSY